MTTFSQGKYALAISDRSGMAFPYNEMVRMEWCVCAYFRIRT